MTSRWAQCTGCKVSKSVTRAHRFPSVELCTDCQRDWMTWLVDEGVADGNPMSLLFWGGVTVWVESRHGGYTGHRLKGFKIEIANSA